MGRSADLPRRSGQTDGDDSGCSILHVDMDAFFASVEIRRHPELLGRPVIVGGGKRGVVSAASYEARRYGVSSAMPMTTALRRCPGAVVLPPDHQTYSAVSAQIMTILRSVTPLVEPLSLDEAFLDVAGVRRLFGRPADIARLIRGRVQAELQLTCSVGIGPSKYVAKLASARCKPDGLLVIPADRVLEFLHPLPITALWGVGPSTAQRLGRLGLRTIGDIAGTPVAVLARLVGDARAEQLAALAAGRDPRVVDTERVEKSISADRTFESDLTTAAEIETELLRLSEQVGRRLRAKGFRARAVGIKIRFADFETISRVRTQTDPVDSTAAIHPCAVELFRSLQLDRPRVRLVGVHADGLVESATLSRQLSFEDILAGPAEASRPAASLAALPSERRSIATTASEAAIKGSIEPTNEGDSVLDRVADAARQRFGLGALSRASLLTGGSGDGVRPPAETDSPNRGPDARKETSVDESTTTGRSGFRGEDSARMLKR